MTIFKRTVLSTFLFFILSLPAAAGEIEVELLFPPSLLHLRPAGQYWDVSFPGCAAYPRIGAPKVPSRPVYVCLPPGAIPRNVRVIAEEKQEISGRYLLSPVPNPGPDAPPAGPDRGVYDNAQPYPSRRAEISGWGDKEGCRIASLLVNPVEYIPRERKLYLSTTIRLSLNWENDSGLGKGITRGTSHRDQAVRRLVENPGDVENFYPLREKTVSSRDRSDYLIITAPSLETPFETLAAHKEGKGLSAEVITTDWIYANYDGDDEAEKIRNCIRDYYQSGGTRWVLVGGGNGVVPMRRARLYAGCSGWQNVPTDLYYACLDGDWNGDGDGYYGEIEDDPDLYPEVAVSRAPVDTAFEAQTFVDKIIDHETGSSYHDKVLLIAEAFDSASPDSESLKGIFPSGWEKAGLYENYAPYGAEEATRDSVLASLHQGRGFINHIGHGSRDGLCTGAGDNSIYQADFDALTNGPHSLIFTQGCSTADPDADNMARHFLLNPEGGGSAYLGNTRVGTTWTIFLNQSFIEGLFQVPIYRPAASLNYARDKIAAMASYFESYLYDNAVLNIFGDPESAYAHRIFYNLELDDAAGGDGDGHLEPGETAEITLTINNFWQDAENLLAELSEDSPLLEIAVSESSFGNVAYGSQTDNAASPFLVALDPSSPESYDIELSLDISSSNGYSETERFILRRSPVYVDWRNQTGPEDGTSEHPYNTIQEGIDAAPEHALILVAAGTYLENIVPKSYLTLRGEDPETTIIDGGSSGSVVSMEALTGCSIENFTLTNGLRPSPGYGGGICCRYCSNLSVENCAIVDNQAHSGGGIYLYRVSGSVSDCLIRENEASYGGGGINCWWGCDMVFNRDIIAYNQAEKGGGIYIEGTADIVHCDIVGNTAASSGGGINFFGGTAYIRNSIISDNSRYGINGELDIYYFTARYSDVGENTPGNINANPARYTTIGTIPSDPGFVDPENGDFSLQSNSPCRDTGEDIGEPFLGDGPDMGALEFAPPTPLPSPTPTISAPPTATVTPSPAKSSTPTPTPTAYFPSATPTATPSLPPTPRPTCSVSCDFNVSGKVVNKIDSSPIAGAPVRLVFTGGATLFDTSGPAGNYSFSVYTPQPPATVKVQSRREDYLPGFATTSWSCSTVITGLDIELVPSSMDAAISGGDYDGDGTSDIAIFRAASGLWAIRGLTRIYYGTAGDDPVTGDFDGDGNTDLGVFRPTSGLWAIRNLTRVYFGDFSDLAVPSDLNGDGTSEICIFRSDAGLWAARAVTRVYFGTTEDQPLTDDFDGDGTPEIGIFRSNSGLWALRNLSRIYFGADGDRLVGGDYDGSASSFPAVFRPSSGLWAIRGLTRIYFGSLNDLGVPADYDGDSLDDIGIFRPSGGLWAVRNISRVYYGTTGDVPVTK